MTAPYNAARAPRIKVWDGFVRFFHWSLVLLLGAAYLSIQTGRQELHALLGYLITALLVSRIVWGLIGPRYARFADFTYRPAAVIHYLGTLRRGHPDQYLGHNPAGGMMVIALLLILTVTTVSGLAVLATIEFSGPLVGPLHGLDDATVYALRHLHGLSVNLIWILIGVHIAGVIGTSLHHRQGLIRAMITGYKQQVWD